MSVSEGALAIPLAVTDPARLAALAEYGIVDTPREQEYDAITRLIAHICEAPIALISFVEDGRQWFKSACNLDASETPLNMSICAHAVAGHGLLEIPDARLDPRTCTNPLVAGDPHICFYAGAPLRTPDGFTLGSLCVIDTKPRSLTGPQRDALKTLGEHVVNLLELRRQLRLKEREISLRQKSELELLRARDAAEAASRAKDRFFATLSHELRTPLTPVLITAAAMADDHSLPECTREIGRMIQRNVQHEVRLIDDLLEVSRIISNKLELSRQSFDLHATVDECISMCSPDAQAKRQKLSIDLRATRPYIIGDPARLKQVLCNLIRNAIRYTPEGGEIAIETLDVGSRVRVLVRDNGVGMEPAKIETMFEPFEQAVRSTGNTGGLGLGLAIAKGFVQAHGGTIRGASDGPGKGSTFTVELPASAAPQTVASEAVVKPSGEALSILLVEDHDDSRRAMKRLLIALKHTVADASTLAGAHELAKTQHFDLIISDVGLPDGSGLDLMRQLRQHAPLKGIALTGYGTESDIAAARKAGFAAHLTKPINFVALQNAIRDVMG